MISSELLSQNYFELFDLPVGFTVDQALLKQKLQQIQKQSHPDKFSNASQQEQMLAMQVSTQANTAYQVLKDDLQRATYLLKLQGIDIGAETDTQMPMDFLMKQMEVRERLANVSASDEGLQTLESIHGELQIERSALIKQLQQYFTQQQFEEAREVARQFQFLDKLHYEIKQKLAAIEDSLLN